MKQHKKILVFFLNNEKIKFIFKRLYSHKFHQKKNYLPKSFRQSKIILIFDTMNLIFTFKNRRILFLQVK